MKRSKRATNSLSDDQMQELTSWNSYFPRESLSKNKLTCKNAVAWIYGSWTLRVMGSWSYSVSTDHYWECAGQPLASFSLSLVTVPEVSAKVNSTQFPSHWQWQLLLQHSIATLLQHCFEWLQHCSNISILCHVQIILCNITLSGECW